jgi:hypothetical protein
VAAQLKTPPPDLTLLAKRNEGYFPFADVYEKIDGREEVKAHGPRQIPVWGYVYTPSPNPPPDKVLNPFEPGLNLPDPEPVVRSRILALVDHLFHMQEK